MILRRVIQHFKHQEWTAIFLDFLIVIVGILVAFQITNWSEASKAKTKETRVIEQLESEFIKTIDGTRKAKANNDIYRDSTLDVLRVIRDGVEPTDKDAFLHILANAGQYGRAPIEPTILTELISSGSLSNLSSPALRRALILYHEKSEEVQKGADLVLTRISSPNDGFHRAIYINPDYQSEGQFFLSHYDWKRLPEAREQFQVLLYGKITLSVSMAELIVRGENVLAEIEETQK